MFMSYQSSIGWTTVFTQNLAWILLFVAFRDVASQLCLRVAHERTAASPAAVAAVRALQVRLGEF